MGLPSSLDLLIILVIRKKSKMTNNPLHEGLDRTKYSPCGRDSWLYISRGGQRTSAVLLIICILHQNLVLLYSTFHIVLQGIARIVVLEGGIQIIFCDFHVGIKNYARDICAVEQVNDLAHTPSRWCDG
jgi:hypothetical protein